MSNENTEESPNYSETVGTRLSPETKRRLDAYKDEHEVGNAEAVRRLVRQALDSEVKDQIRLATAAAGLAYLTAFLGAGPTAGAAVGGSYIAAILIWTSWPSGP